LFGDIGNSRTETPSDASASDTALPSATRGIRSLPDFPSCRYSLVATLLIRRAIFSGWTIASITSAYLLVERAG
jgi:hypothetical protein